METKKIHRIDNVTVSDKEMKLTVDDKTYTFPLMSISKRLADVDDLERSHFEISPSGYGIHWPDIDEDSAIDSMIGSRNPVERRPSPKQNSG